MIGAIKRNYQKSWGSFIRSGVNRRGHREMGKFYGVFPAKASAFIVIWFESVKAKATVVPLRYL